MPAEMGGSFCWHISWLTKSAGRFTDCQQIYWQKWGVFLLVDFLTHQICWQIYWLSANLLAEIGDIFAGRFTDCQQIYWQKWGVFLLADFLTHQICWQIYCHQICQQKWGVFLLPYFLTHQTCWQIYWLSANLLAEWGDNSAGRFLDSPNLLADLLIVSKSAGRNRGCFCWQIYWLSANLLAEMGGISAGRFPDSPNLLADLLTVSKSGRNTPTICWQKYLDISASRFTDCQQIWQKYPYNLPAEIPRYCCQHLTARKSAGRNTRVFLPVLSKFFS